MVVTVTFEVLTSEASELSVLCTVTLVVSVSLSLVQEEQAMVLTARSRNSLLINIGFKSLG